MNEEGFAYDVHSLVKAFFPACDVKVLNDENENAGSSSEGCPDLVVEISDEKIICLLVNGIGAENAGIIAKKVELGGNKTRIEVKNDLKSLVYAVLSECTGRHLPWGTLTGIRPTKIPMADLEEGKSKEEILSHMKSVYLVSDKKAQLALDIAEREKKLLDGIHRNDGYSLYIGIPFCPTTCLYCSFTSYPIASWKRRVFSYLRALEKEIAFAAQIYRDKILDTVYIGGGTPTTLDAKELEELLGFLRKTLDFTHVKEFTVEAGRADSITPEKLDVLQKYGVTRISVNPQTMKQETLKLIGRQHTVEQVKDAFHLAREKGVSNINMDLILGLPGEDAADVAATIEAVKNLSPDSLTVHSLAIKRASRLHQWITENGISMLNNTDETMQIAEQGAADMDMKPYYLYRQKNMSGNFENVGYARAGKEGLYNIAIMEEVQDIIACGAGTVSKRLFENGRIERCDTVKDVALYIEKIDEMIERKRALFAPPVS